MRGKLGTMIAIAAITAVMVAPATVWAIDQFADVPDTNVFHDDITWLKDAGVTLGCNPPDNTQFCPSDNVTREQMAAFMRRLAENQVVDAGTLGGMDPTEFMTTAYVASDEGFVDVPASTTTDVMTLDLPAGSYLINARGSMNRNTGALARDITCTLTAGTTTQTLQNFQMDDNGGVDTLEVTFMIAHSFDADGQAVLSCEAQGTWDGNVLDPTITAIPVHAVEATIIPAGSGGGPND